MNLIHRAARSTPVARYIGSVFGTYPCWKGAAWIVLDQHTARERILYEHLLGRAGWRVPAQPLLVPAMLGSPPAKPGCSSPREWVKPQVSISTFSSHEVAIAIPENEIVPAPALLLYECLLERLNIRRRRKAVLHLAYKAASSRAPSE